MTLSELSSKLEHITTLNSQEYHELFSCVEYDFKHPIIIKPHYVCLQEARQKREADEREMARKWETELIERIRPNALMLIAGVLSDLELVKNKRGTYRRMRSCMRAEDMRLLQIKISEDEEKMASYYAPRITQIIDNYLGKGKKVNEMNRDQVEQLVLIIDDLKVL
jgi:hypothetical protein